MFPALLPNFVRADLAFAHGDGAYLWTEDGRKFLDFGAGIATSSIGHAHPHLVETIARRASMVMHVSNIPSAASRTSGATAGGSVVRG